MHELSVHGFFSYQHCDLREWGLDGVFIWQLFDIKRRRKSAFTCAVKDSYFASMQ